jgi:hypothetical protein
MLVEKNNLESIKNIKTFMKCQSKWPIAKKKTIELSNALTSQCTHN